jgi:hypothetical protein
MSTDGPHLAQVGRRNYYRFISHAGPGGREHHTVTAPRRGPNRERARRAILTVLRRAEGNQQRVGFTVTYADGTRRVLGGKGGYDPERVLLGCRIEAQDPYAWLSTQLEDRAPDGVAIIGLDLDSWPATRQAC